MPGSLRQNKCVVFLEQNLFQVNQPFDQFIFEFGSNYFPGCRALKTDSCRGLQVQLKIIFKARNSESCSKRLAIRIAKRVAARVPVKVTIRVE